MTLHTEAHTKRSEQKGGPVLLFSNVQTSLLVYILTSSPFVNRNTKKKKQCIHKRCQPNTNGRRAQCVRWVKGEGEPTNNGIAPGLWDKIYHKFHIRHEERYYARIILDPLHSFGWACGRGGGECCSEQQAIFRLLSAT